MGAVPFFVFLHLLATSASSAAAEPQCEGCHLGTNGTVLLQNVPPTLISKHMESTMDDMESELHTGLDNDDDGDARDSDIEAGRTKKAQRTDTEYVMSIEEAHELDEATLKVYPHALPQVPIMYPDTQDVDDSAIASKLEGLNRDSQIRLVDERVVPYWQTIQYAHRNFRIFVTRFRVPVGKKTWDTFDQAQKIKLWGMHGLMRKILCTDAFRNWTMASKYEESATPETVYARFESANKGTYISMRDIKGAKAAVANVIGIVIDSKWFSNAADSYILAILAHEQSHNLGYSHKSQVPYPLQKFLSRVAYPEMAKYESIDLAKYPDFEVLNHHH